MSSVRERGEKGRGIVLRSVKVSERVIGGERRWCVDEVVGEVVLRKFLVKTHEAWHVLKLVVRGGRQFFLEEEQR